MKTTNLFIFFILAALSLSCEKSENRNPLDFQLGQSFELPFGDTGNCTCGGLSVAFADVLDDSRCPTSVVCFWEGQARVQLKVQIADGLDTVELIRRAGHEELGRDTLDNFVFELLEVSPYPVTTDPIDKEDYRIELKVSAL